MSFCPQCGAQTGAGMRFCPSCGAALAAAAVPVDTVAAPGSDYRLILISCGGCSRTQAQSLLRDTLGYTATEARTLTARKRPLRSPVRSPVSRRCIWRSFFPNTECSLA